MEKFHHFLCTAKFELDTNQKTFETRILIKTVAYDFTMKYLPGKNNQLADCLSRLGCLQDKIKLPRLKVHLLTTHLNVTSDKLQQI